MDKGGSFFAFLMVSREGGDDDVNESEKKTTATTFFFLSFFCVCATLKEKVERDNERKATSCSGGVKERTERKAMGKFSAASRSS